jgi:hypothetical protein
MLRLYCKDVITNMRNELKIYRTASIDDEDALRNN